MKMSSDCGTMMNPRCGGMQKDAPENALQELPYTRLIPI